MLKAMDAELAAASEATNNALADLMRTNESLVQVAQYCKDAYAGATNKYTPLFFSFVFFSLLMLVLQRGSDGANH